MDLSASCVICGISHSMGNLFSYSWSSAVSQLGAEQEPHTTKKQQNIHGSQTCRPVALEYDPARHGAQTDDDVAPAVESILVR